MTPFVALLVFSCASAAVQQPQCTDGSAGSRTMDVVNLPPVVVNVVPNRQDYNVDIPDNCVLRGRRLAGVDLKVCDECSVPPTVLLPQGYPFSAALVRLNCPYITAPVYAMVTEYCA